MMLKKTDFKQGLRRNEIAVAIGLTVVLIFFAVVAVVSYRNATFLSEDAKRVAHTHEVITSLLETMSLMKDAETGQRGYLITGDVAYLEPFQAAKEEINQQLAEVEDLVADNPTQLSLLSAVKTYAGTKFEELTGTLEARRAQGFEAAKERVLAGHGKAAMDDLRRKIAEMMVIEKGLRERRIAQMNDAYLSAVVSGLLTALAGAGLSVIMAVIIRRTLVAQNRQEWLQAGRLGLSKALTGERSVGELGGAVLEYLTEYFGAHAGAIFARREQDFELVATFGVPVESKTPKSFVLGDGLLGEVARDGKTILINDVPEGYLTVGSGLGRGNPRQLVISSTAVDGVVNGVLELGFLHPLDEAGMALLEQAAEAIGTGIRSAHYRENLQALLEETQRQSEELQTQSEELRVSNEELEEQSRALKESQTRLEQQQAELEQTNSQLEEQAQLLEVQRDDLTKANEEVQAKATEVERASRYKSDFLANMSHELRTPLNSSLILSKLLADNTEGNLTAEQVKYAQTIQSSGNDLLTLINDILDLSKIEAGHMEVHAETVPVSRVAAELQRMFEPVAKLKGLEWSVKVQAGCPETIETDALRLQQILKNLLSNACKFTEQGGVSLIVKRSAGGWVEFAVKDTGIGISPEHQKDIFDAFRQADGTISRKFGGTGLGLSISRELAKLLGGAIRLESEHGRGSTFTVDLPVKREGGLPFSAEPEPLIQPEPPEGRTVLGYLPDDRDQLTAASRTILVVEDDEEFAKILYAMVHELNFQCVMARTAEDALVMARQYQPSAVLLDVGLPDHSGLSVLDRLKQDTRTRHIPIHVVSAGDHSQTALSLGAVGYMLKPVKREDLLEALKQMEARFASAMRQVLIVEDDEVQRESLMKLLGSNEVQTVAVGTAAECLEKLKESTFDCMVLDLSLPDSSGYVLLETLSKEDAYSFPPVIVYTGRDISHVDEQKLRRYSRSIIIKGAKSPERLLDEVTLFLHQVVAELPPEQQKMLKKAQNRDAVLEGRRILIVEDDVRNVYALTNILEPRGAIVQIARNGREALEALDKAGTSAKIDLILMDMMMPEMDGVTATRAIRERNEWKKLPVIMLTAKAMKNDQERCLAAGASDYMAKPIDVEKLLSLVRVWMPR